MAINKVVYGNQTLVDLTSDTVEPGDVAQGKTFHDRSGATQTGTLIGIDELSELSDVDLTNPAVGDFLFFDGTNWVNGKSGLLLAEYGVSTYAQVLAAYQAHAIVYCKASSNSSDPSVGAKTRQAFLAYVNDETTPTEFEFQYYKSTKSHVVTNQTDEVYVYKLNSSTGWSNERRWAGTQIAVSDGLTGTYGATKSGTYTLKVDTTFTEAATASNIDSGDTLSTIFGKIKKFFSDLKTVAFTGAYSDLSGTPTNLNQFTNGPGYITSSGSCASATTAGSCTGNAATATTASNLSGFENNNSTAKNANDVTYNAHTYYTSNGPSTSLGASTADGALYSQAYSSSWVAQIAQDYRNGRLFVRGKNNGTWKSWIRIAQADEAIADISRSGTTFTATRVDGTKFTFTQQDNNTTYSGNNGVGLSGTTFYNTGVRATSINGNYLRVNTNGTNADLTIPYASSAGSVAWGNVSSRPTKVSQFTNDSGYITSSGSCASATKFNGLSVKSYTSGSATSITVKFSGSIGTGFVKVFGDGNGSGIDFTIPVHSSGIGSPVGHWVVAPAPTYAAGTNMWSMTIKVKEWNTLWVMTNYTFY